MESYAYSAENKNPGYSPAIGWGISELTQKDKRGKKTANPCVTSVTILFEIHFPQTSLFFIRNIFL